MCDVGNGEKSGSWGINDYFNSHPIETFGVFARQPKIGIHCCHSGDQITFSLN